MQTLPQTSEDIEAIYASGPAATVALVQQLLAQVQFLSQRVAELEERLSRNSHNSNQPPSSDGFNRKPRSLRQRSGKRPGGQAGHPGQTLRFSAQPDALVLHRPSNCSACGAGLADVPAAQTQRRQVVDLPPLRLQTTEHQVETVCCPACQHLSSGAFPGEAAEAVQYGPQIKALALYLRTYQLLPSARTSELLADLFGAAPSEGTLDTIVQHAASKLAPLVERIRQQLRAAGLIHVDETGCYVADKRWWLHVASTSKLTLYFVHRQRGHGGSAAAGVLPEFGGIAVHDSYASYWEYSCAHALCCAHILRELIAEEERSGQAWAADLAGLLREMLAASAAGRAAGLSELPAEQVASLVERYDELVAEGLASNPVRARPPEQPRGNVKQSKATNLLLRLREHAAEVLRFLQDLRVPFDNNQAERDLRMMKVQQKISGRFRTQRGAAAFCVIRSYISTLRKQGQSVLAALEQAFRATPVPAPAWAE
jgi:transposase